MFCFFGFVYNSIPFLSYSSSSSSSSSIYVRVFLSSAADADADAERNSSSDTTRVGRKCLDSQKISKKALGSPFLLESIE